MTDNRIKEAYRQIKAPDHLRERVMRIQPRDTKILAFPANRLIKTVASVAACFMVVAVIAVALFVNDNNPAAIIISGETVGESPVEIIDPAAMRSLVAPVSLDGEVSVEFTLECKGECRVSVNCGEIVDEKEVYSSGDTVVWNVTDIPEEGALLYLEYGDKTSTYTLDRTGDTGVWTINKQ